MLKGLVIIALCIIYTLILFSLARVFQTIAWMLHYIRVACPSVVAASPVIMKCGATVETSVRATVVRKKNRAVDRCCASEPATSFRLSLTKPQSMPIIHRRG